MSQWPSFSEELSRKTTESACEWVKAYDKGEIDLFTLRCITRTLWSQTSGLVDQETSNLLTELDSELNTQMKNEEMEWIW